MDTTASRWRRITILKQTKQTKMPPVLAYILFTILGAVIGAGVIIMIGYRLNKKKPAARDILAQELEKFFSNTQRNTLAELRRLNPERCKVFGHSIQDMGLAFWATATAGECGEMCNIIKKKLRGDQVADFHGKVGREAADQVIYLDLLCTFLGISLEEFIILKFNEVSTERGSLIKL
jgi:NTP pyrophosphatase (non-canonical NTP hydrolase)